MAADVARAKPQFDQDMDRFRQFFTTQALLRNMPAAMMLRSDQSVIVKADIRLPPEVQDPPLPPVERLCQISDAQAVAGILRDTNYICGLRQPPSSSFTVHFTSRALPAPTSRQTPCT